MGNIEARGGDITLASLQRQMAWQRAAIVVLALLWVLTAAWFAMRGPSVPAVLAVERLEIVEPDGKPALVLANSQRPIAATIDGRQIMSGQEEERRGIPSIIFFDGKGDEVGGMLFGVRETSGGGYSVTRHLSLDGHEQDQTVVLAHYQDPKGSTSGLTISDRPDHSQLETFRQLGLEPGASRDQLTKAILAIPEEQRAARRRELFGSTRAFFGSARGGAARLELRDGQGRVRLVLEAPEDGEASLRMLDENGKEALRLPTRRSS
jgi:hypothetical protein